MLRFITGLDVTLCQSSPPSATSTTFLPPSLPPSHSLSFFSLFYSHSFHLSLSITPHPLCSSPSLSLSLFLSFSLCLSSVCLSPSVVSGAVLNRGLFVHKHALSWPLPYLLVSRAAVALLCVTAQPLFVLPAWILFILAVDIL